MPPAVLSLVHRNHLITWLEAQWTWSEARPSRAAEEERGRYLTILDNLVIVLVQREQRKEQKRLADGAAESRNWSAEGREWARGVETIIKAALPTAGMSEAISVTHKLIPDATRLSHITRTLLRLSQMASPCSVPPLLPLVTARLVQLFPTPTHDPGYTMIVERLFEVTSVLPCRGEGKLLEAVEEIGWRVRLLDTEVGRWVRRETRLAAWESRNGEEDR